MAKGKAAKTGAEKIEVVLMRVVDLFPHPDNPRTVRTETPGFLDLLASVQANGVLEPLTVRRTATLRDGQYREVLSGHRRLQAAIRAGLKAVPVIDKGDLPDHVAFDLVALGNLHEPLTPLEEGRRVATWLDKYGQDVAAVASKLGKPEHWVVQHAQIARGLSAEWQKAAEQPLFERWTAAHWVHIAKLPVALQATQLTRFCNHTHGYPRDMSAARVEECVKVDLLYLVKASFDVATVCRGCLNRTDRQPLLWAEAAEEATGEKARCLDKECWEKKTAAHAKAAFKAVAGDKGVPDAVPISLLEEPKDYYRAGDYKKKISGLKKQYGPKLLTADRFEVVPEGTRGAQAAIVVAGARGKGALSVKWIKPTKEKSGGGRSAGGYESPKMKAERRARELGEQAMKKVGARLLVLTPEELPAPRLGTLWILRELDRCGSERVIEKLLKLHAQGEAAILAAMEAEMWRQQQEHWKHWQQWGGWWAKEEALAEGRLLGVDVQAIYDAVVAEETPAEPAPSDEDSAKPKGKRASGASRRKKAKEKKTEAAGTPGVCRVCGCTEKDCSGCWDRTGQACHWVDETRTLCSACASDEGRGTSDEEEEESDGDSDETE